jgi:ADP-ribose pyrophosphatase YjhB (NUDIX family)
MNSVKHRIVIFVFVDEDELVWTDKSTDTIMPVCGHVRKGERVDTAKVRILKEFTGVKARSYQMRFVGSYTVKRDDIGTVKTSCYSINLFHMDVSKDDVKALISNREHLQLQLLSVDDMCETMVEALNRTRRISEAFYYLSFVHTAVS